MINRSVICKKNNQYGRSMVEMLGVLAIVGVLSVGGIAGYIKASHQLRTNQLKDDLSHFIANIRTTFFTQTNYSSMTVENVIKSGIVPDHMISTDKTQIIHRKYGRVLVGPADIKNKEDGAFILVYNGLDAATCRDLASEKWGSDVQTGFMGMAIYKDKENGITIEESGLTEAEFETTENVFNSIDIPQALIQQSYNSCYCTGVNTCSIAWKFM